MIHKIMIYNSLYEDLKKLAVVRHISIIEIVNEAVRKEIVRAYDEEEITI